jgi:hypothetical protein
MMVLAFLTSAVWYISRNVGLDVNEVTPINLHAYLAETDEMVAKGGMQPLWIGIPGSTNIRWIMTPCIHRITATLTFLGRAQIDHGIFLATD